MKFYFMDLPSGESVRFMRRHEWEADQRALARISRELGKEEEAREIESRPFPEMWTVLESIAFPSPKRKAAALAIIERWKQEEHP